MSNSFFRFKRFCIHHDRCAMKVGTDGVLLGAWGCVDGKNILDIGTGTGLIALMAAQRNPEASVLGIDIDKEAILQAKENIAESPFSDRVNCALQDVISFCPAITYDSILCNPPFFTEETLPDDIGRALARNSRSLPFSQLIKKVTLLLNNEGRFSVIIPSSHMQEFIGLCLAEMLYLNRRCVVRTKLSKPPRRVLLTFTKEQAIKVDEQEICIMSDDGNRSMAYKELTESFYL